MGMDYTTGKYTAPTSYTSTYRAPSSSNSNNDYIRKLITDNMDELARPNYQTLTSSTGLSDYARGQATSIFDQLKGLENYNPFDTSKIKNVADVSADTLEGRDLSGYMNPRMAAVADVLRHQADIERQKIRQRALASGAGSSARAALLENANNEALQRQLGLAEAENYDAGVAAFQSDAARKLQAALANQGEAGTMERFRATAAIGENKNANDQRLTAAQIRNSYLSALPAETTTTRQEPGPSIAGQKIGAALALQGLGSSGGSSVESALRAKGYNQATINTIMAMDPIRRQMFYGV